MEKICKNCKHFYKQAITEFLWMRDKNKPLDFIIGNCGLEPFDVSSMNSDQMAVVCGHDGGVLVGEDFGCVNWEAKEK